MSPKMLNWYVKEKVLEIGKVYTVYYDKLFEFPQKCYKFVDVRAKYYGDFYFSIERDGEWSSLYDFQEFSMDKAFLKRTQFCNAGLSKSQVSAVNDDIRKENKRIREKREEERKELEERKKFLERLPHQVLKI